MRAEQRIRRSVSSINAHRLSLSAPDFIKTLYAASPVTTIISPTLTFRTDALDAVFNIVYASVTRDGEGQSERP